MNKHFVLTGDIIGFTSMSVSARKKLLDKTATLLNSWVEAGHASIFRGDSFQILFNDINTALDRAIQLRCWFKMHSLAGKQTLDARMVIGMGKIAYFGKSVLESDGEAFHLSGRAFDELEEGQNLRIVSPGKELNDQLEVMLDLAEVIIGNWTVSQAEVIYLLLENKKQQEMARELKIGQSAVNNRIKLSNWKAIEKMNRYIENLIGNE